MANDTKNMILKWEDQRSLGKSNLIDNYESFLENFLDRGLIEPKDYTEYGNVKLYKMPLPIFDELRNLAPIVKQEIYNVVNSHYLELPF